MVDPVSFPNQDITFITPTWEELDLVALRLATRIRESGRQFDRLVTLAKGGWAMSRSLVDFLDIPQVASIGIRFYAGINQRLKEPEIYQEIPVSVKGERVLLFDDVADSGESLVFTQDHLIKGGVAEVTTATLYYKPRSVLKPDFYGDQTSSWIIFPFEIMESIHEVAVGWQKQGSLSKEELSANFARLGVRREFVEYYFTWYKSKK